MADLRVKIAGLELANPVLTASGTFGYGIEYQDFIDLSQLGGIIVKGTTLEPREGNPYPRMAETAQGMLNCVGLQNKGVDYFCQHIYPQIKDIKTNMIVNVSGNSPEDYAECAARINELDCIPAIELNISCPNVKHGFRHDDRGRIECREGRQRSLREDAHREALAECNKHHGHRPCSPRRRCRCS